MSHSATAPGAVTFESVREAMRESVSSGRIGTPVNVRIHWQFSGVKPSAAADVAVQLADAALSLDKPAWRVRTAAENSQVNVLGEDAGGKTVLISLVRGSTPEFALTVFGNHGTLKLEHASLDEDSLPSGDAESVQLFSELLDGENGLGPVRLPLK